MKWFPSGKTIKREIVLAVIAGGVAWGVAEALNAWAKRKKAAYGS